MSHKEDPRRPEWGAGTESDEVGTVAEEAVKLLGAMSGWAREHGDGIATIVGSAANSAAEDLHDHFATGSSECSWCPVCRTLTAVRNISPEVKAHLTSAATSFMMAVSEMLGTQPPTHHGDVERIDLDDDPAEEQDDHFGDRSEDPA